jgi:ketopantoate reductase
LKTPSIAVIGTGAIGGFYGNPLRAARAKGVEIPLIGMIYSLLKFLDEVSRGCD